MKKASNVLIAILTFLIFAVNTSGQSQDDSVVNLQIHKQGTFYLSPFYEYTQFKELELVSHTNHYKLYEGNADYTFTDEEIQEYNDNFDTEYQNSLVGVKVGYQVLDGLGVNAYFGVNHFNFKSWVSDENTQTYSNEYPEFTLGLSADYKRNIYENLTAILNFNINYSKSGSSVIDNNSGENVVSSQLTASFWEADLAFAYSINKFHPFAGIGYTEQHVNSLHEESILTSDENGNDFYNKTEFDSDYKGNSVYGFAGLEYSFSENLSMYARSSFMNPLRANVGIRIIL
jgi:hypothetical protein